MQQPANRQTHCNVSKQGAMAMQWVLNNYDTGFSMQLVLFAMWSDHRLYNEDQVNSPGSCSHELRVDS
jgi:hypothetical protein